MRYLILLILTIVGITYGNNCYAYDTEIDGLLYDWVSYNSSDGPWGKVTLVGYSSSKITEDLNIPCFVTWNSKKKGTYNRSCQVGTVGANAFKNCEIIKKVDFCGVNGIMSNSFEGCILLESITISNSINLIGPKAFSNCTALSEIIINDSQPPTLYDDAFDENTYLTATLIVPQGSVNVYKNTESWCKFKNITDGTNEIKYTLDIIASGSGYASYSGTTIRNKTGSFIVNEGTSATITFTPDTGYRIKSVKVNSADVTSSVSNNSYTISSITANTTLEVEFEAIPVTTYTLSIKATGNGSASYNGTSIRDKTSSFTVNEGTAVTITLTPDDGYRIKSVKVNSTDVTSSVSNNSYTISSITANTTLEVEFEAIPPTTYTLSIKATGNGSATYDGTTIRSKTSSFTVNEGTSATITFTPDDGYRIKSVKVNSTDVTSSVSNNSYTINSISTNTTLEVEFEAIPVTTYTLSIKATGNGSATYGGTTIRSKTSSFTVNEGTSATISFTPDTGYRIKSVKVNSADVTSNVSNNSYTISSISTNTTLEVEFEAIPPTTYTLSITASGNGSASYSGTTIRSKTSSFTVNEGTSATISFTPDNGYKIKSVKVNSTDVTSSVTNNSYTISNIASNTTLEVEFEAIPPTTYTLSIIASGNGSASYSGTTIRSKTSSFTVNEGTSATISFTPDTGYRIKGVKVNNTDVTSNVTNNSYTISNISANTTLEVEFEAIPIPTYTLSIKATGNGSASYNGTTVRSKTSSFSVNEGTSATISFTPDNGYRIKSVKVNSTDVTSSVTNNSYTISNIASNTTLEVEFEAIPPTIYTLSITASGNGSASYSGTTIRSKTSSFTVNEGTSVSITLTPDNGYRIKSVKENDTNVTSYVSNNIYTINSISRNTTIEVEFEAIPPTTYTLSITASGNGSASYSGTAVRSKTSSFSVNEGTSATISFSPDNGYRIKSVKVNNTDVTSNVTNNSYTISNISANTTLEVEFEAIPIPTYTLSIKATGNGSASYNGTTVRSKTSSFSVNEGTSATISFTPDNGYRIKSVKVNNTDVTSTVTNNSYTISNITGNTTLEVEFEITTYTLSISATGNGKATYNSTDIRSTTKAFTINHGTSATVSFTPDSGYKIKSVKVNNTNVTSSVTNNSYTISNISANTTLAVEFEVITYTLKISSTGNGVATYNGTEVRSTTKTFTVTEGASATVSFSPDNGNSLNSVKVNSTDVTSQVTSNRYTISNIKANATLEVIYIEDITAITAEGVNYKVVSQSDGTINLATGDYGQVLTVPVSVTSNNKTWQVVGIEQNALKGNNELAAIIWNPAITFNAEISNPNLLLYVKDGQYAPPTIQNVVVNNVADKIVLIEAASGNKFYCPQSFTAHQISYTHNYKMQTGVDESRGWETIALPFDVQTITHEGKGNIKAFANWNHGDAEKPFWLYELTGNGFVESSSIKANTPYIISMPNHPRYDNEWLLKGKVTFAASNVSVCKTEDVVKQTYGDRTFVPCFSIIENNEGVYALNVNNDYETNTSGMTEGSKFVLNMRRVHPFEAYMTTSSNAPQYSIGIFDGMTTGIRTIEEAGGLKEEFYDLQGRKTNAPTQKGVYIKNRKKVIIK